MCTVNALMLVNMYSEMENKMASTINAEEHEVRIYLLIKLRILLILFLKFYKEKKQQMQKTVK